jgi:hypothetical protein
LAADQHMLWCAESSQRDGERKLRNKTMPNPAIVLEILGLTDMQTPQSITACFRRSSKTGNTHFVIPSHQVGSASWFLKPAALVKDWELCSSEEAISLGSGIDIRKETILFLRVVPTCQMRRLGINATVVAPTNPAAS